jgi:hypothetical protein
VVKYVVDAVGYDEWTSGDDGMARRYSKDEGRVGYSVKLTHHCNMRAGEGWRLQSILPDQGVFWLLGSICGGIHRDLAETARRRAHPPRRR